MPFIQENLIEINIGLKNEYKLIHFSDVHAITYKEDDPQEEIEKAINNEKGWDRGKGYFAQAGNEHYDESHMIPSIKCLENIINYVNEEKPIAVVMSGDIIDYYSPSNYELLLEQCGNLNYPFVFACGNHESPVEQYEELTMNESGFVVLEFNEFKIVSLDDSKKLVTKKTLDSLKKELRSKKPIIIVMHIPVCTSYNREEMKRFGEYYLIRDDDPDETTKEFVNLLINNDTIKAILCGHVHMYSESCFAPNKKQYCASSGLIGKVNKITVK